MAAQYTIAVLDARDDLVLDEQVVARCVVRDHYGVRIFLVPALPPSPFLCPHCRAPFWSRGARCHGAGAGHPRAAVTPRRRPPMPGVSRR